MKIIDLLNKIANEELVPMKIKYDNKIWEYRDEGSGHLYYEIDGCNSIEDMYFLSKSLNDEVEVIEEKEIENIPFDNEMPLTMMEMYHQLEKYNYKINQIIDVINDMRDKEC